MTTEDRSWGSQANHAAAAEAARNPQPAQQPAQQPQSFRDAMLARLAEQERNGTAAHVRTNDDSTRVRADYFDDTAWGRPDSGPLADARYLNGNHCVVTKDSNPENIIVTVRGVGMRLSNALKLGLLVDEVADHVGHASAQQQPLASTTTPEAAPKGTPGEAKVEPVAPTEIDIKDDSGESIGAELDVVAELAQSAGQDFGAVVKSALETGELNPTVAQAMVRANLIDDISHGTEWVQGAIAATEAAVAKNFYDAGYQGAELLAAVTERASAGELQQAALQLILGKGDVSGFVKLAHQYVLDRGHGAMFARSY